jgi:DNA repair protein RecO (recombination protein O)
LRWQGEGVLLDVRKYGESSALIDVFTLSLGRRIGLLRGALNKKNKAIIQPGNQLFLTWNSRIEESLGVFKIELIKSRYHKISEERDRLEFFNMICVLCSTFLPERVDFDELYHKTILYIEGEFSTKEKFRKYIEWELQLLQSLGFGLDLGKCVVSGSKEDLKFVSPKSGCAVSRKSSAGWEDKLLVLPEFLAGIRSKEKLSKADIENGFKLTEYFIKKNLLPVKRFQVGSFFSLRNRLLSLNSL